LVYICADGFLPDTLAQTNLYPNYFMRGISTIALLLLSNVFMTFAWYGHLKFQHLSFL